MDVVPLFMVSLSDREIDKNNKSTKDSSVFISANPLFILFVLGYNNNDKQKWLRMKRSNLSHVIFFLDTH